MTYILISLLGIYYTIYAYNNLEKAFWINYFILLSLPIGGSIHFINIFVKILQYVTIINTFLIFIKSFSKSEDNRESKISFVDIIVLLLFINYIIYLFIGFKKGYSAIADSKQYFLQVMLYYSAIKILGENSFKKFLNVTIYALFTNSIITLTLYILRNISFLGITLNVDGRFSFGYQSLFIFSIPYLVYLINKEGQGFKLKFFVLISVVFQSILLLLSQNRTNPALIIVGVLFLYFINLKQTSVNDKKSDAKNVFVTIFLLLITILGSMILLNYLISLNSPIIQRYLDILNKTNSYVNYEGRVVTADYYKNLIFQKPLGYGLGILMPLITLDYDFYQLDGLNIDNAFITFPYKLGVVNFILYLLVLVLTYHKLLKIFLKNKDYNYMYLIILAPLIVFATGALTSQMLHNISVFSFIWVMMGILNKNYSKLYR